MSTSILASSVTFPISGKVAPNRFVLPFFLSDLPSMLLRSLAARVQETELGFLVENLNWRSTRIGALSLVGSGTVKLELTFFLSLGFGHVVLPSFSRFLKSAMTERLCTYDKENHDLRGKPTPEYLAVYEKWGQGSIGIIVLGELSLPP